MEWVVTTGRTIEEALEAALDQLGVDEQDAEMEVVQEPQRGLFGRVRAEATIRARIRPSPPPPKLDRRDRRRDKRGRVAGRPNRSRVKVNGSSTSGQPGGAEGGPADDGNGSGPPAEASAPSTEGSGSMSAGAGARRRRRRRRSGRGDTAEGAGAVSDSTTATTAGVASPVLDIEAQRAAVEAFLAELLAAFGRGDAALEVTAADEETIEATVDGPELGLLVGPKGATLQSLQELVRSVVQRRFVGQSHARVRLDVAGYRERRRQALERFTADVAKSVVESGVAKALDPMGAADRKVVHDTINTIDGVETVSEGEDAYRHVVIRPST